MKHNTIRPSQDELTILEKRLAGHGSVSLGHEKSLNSIFKTHLASGGSRRRALIALSTGKRLGLPDTVRFPIATAVELLHQASLIHDDVQDQDRLRRGQHAVWQIAGTSTAICLGDDLIASAFEELASIPSPFDVHLPRLILMLSDGISAMAAGQTLDCQWMQETSITIEAYEKIVRHKSGPLLGLPVAMCSVLVGCTDSIVNKTLDAASSIGIAYQLADDLVDRNQDYGKRLNGYWVIAQQTEPDQDSETMLRERFIWHLDQARQTAEKLPTLCLIAIEELITALYSKYPSLQEAA